MEAGFSGASDGKSNRFPERPAEGTRQHRMRIGGMNGVGMVFSLTAGGPGTATEVLSYLLYSIGFTQLDFGKAAALSVFIFSINLILIGVSLRVSRSRAELI